MLSDKEKEELQELINLLYNGHISQYGKRKLEKYIEKQSKEIEEAEQKEKKAYIDGTNIADQLCNKKWKDKIKAKIEEVQKRLKEETRTDFLIILKILENELQSLLEKE